MKRFVSRVVAVLLPAVGLVSVPSASQAVLVGNMYLVTASKQVARNGESYASLSVACPAGTTPAWGGYYDERNDDIRRIDEVFGYGSGASYTVDIVDYSNNGIYGFTQVTAQAMCISLSNFSAQKTVVSNSYVDSSTHLAVGSVGCGSGWTAMGVSVYFNSSDSTVLTSSPLNDNTSWIARGWIGTAGKQMTVVARCVQGAALDALRVYAHSDAVSWGSSASATCPAGFTMLTGGTYHQGDGQAITIDPQLVNRTLQSRSLGDNSTMYTTVVCLPTSNPQVNLTGTPYPALDSSNARWSFTVTDPASAGGYTISTTCQLRKIVEAGDWPVIYDFRTCSSPVEEGNLEEGGYELTVKALTSDGRSDTEWWHVIIDHTDPVVTFTDPSGSAFKTSSVNLGAQVTDALSLVTGLTCALDNATPTTCGSGDFVYSATDPGCLDGCARVTGPQLFAYADLSDGSHVLHVTATDSHGNTHTYDLPFKVDTVAPAVTQSSPSARFTVATKATVAWSGVDAVSGIADYGIQWRAAPYNADFGPWSTPVTSPATKSSRTFTGLARGATYCFGVDATDAAGNTSPWTEGLCTAIPLDDRDAADAGGWRAITQQGWYEGTAMASKKLGASLAVTGATVKRVGVVAKTCPTCGKVGVYVAGTLIGKVNLKAGATSRKLLVLPPFSLVTGTVKVKVLTSDKLVQIDAIGLSRV